jgi:hypothetical protein
MRRIGMQMDKEKLEIENEQLKKLLKDKEDEIAELKNRLLKKENPQKSEEDENLFVGLMEGCVDSKSFFMQAFIDLKNDNRRADIKPEQYTKNIEVMLQIAKVFIV